MARIFLEVESITIFVKYSDGGVDNGKGLVEVVLLEIDLSVVRISVEVESIINFVKYSNE